MEKEEAIKTIITQCEDIDGFLLKLRMMRVFDVAKYQPLIDAIVDYKTALGEETLIDRHVAGCLFYLVQILQNAEQAFTQAGLENQDAIRKANATVWGLVEELFM